MSISKLSVYVSIIILFSVFSFTVSGELIGYWSFDEEDGVTDLSGNGNDGLIHGNPLVVEGKSGDALEFNGTSDYVAIPDAKIISELDALAISARIQPKKHGAWVAVLEKGIHENWSYGFFIEADGTLSFYVSTGPANTLVCCVGDVALSIDQWYHIFGSYDGNSVKAYVDGKLEGEMAGNGVVHVTEGLPFTIGSRNGQNFFTGVVDEVAFWDEAISVEESMNPSPVQPRDKLTLTWGMIKDHL